MTPRLVPDWRDCWRWYSSHCMWITVALQGAWLELPVEMKASVPTWGIHAITIVLLVLGFFGRLVDQPRRAP